MEWHKTSKLDTADAIYIAAQYTSKEIDDSVGTHGCRRMVHIHITPNHKSDSPSINIEGIKTRGGMKLAKTVNKTLKGLKRNDPSSSHHHLIEITVEDPPEDTHAPSMGSMGVTGGMIRELPTPVLLPFYP